MPEKRHARCPSYRWWFSAGSVRLGAVLLSAFILPSFGNASAPKHTVRPLSVRKELPKCAPAANAPAKDLPADRVAPGQTNLQSTEESQAQDSPASDSLKLESVQTDGVQSSELECAPGQSGTDDNHCEAAKAPKDSALQCVREPGQKPDLAIDPGPAK